MLRKALYRGIIKIASLIVIIFLVNGLFTERKALSQYQYKKTASLSKGKFLVATGNINDPRFMETVIILTGYGELGAAGVVINRPTRVPLSKVLPKIEGFKDRNDTIYIGGPVESHKISFLIRSAKQPNGSRHLFKDVYVSSNVELIQSDPARGHKDMRVRAYMGYAGWAPRQLEKEVMRGDWLVMDADASTVFDKDPEEVWEELLRRGSLQEVAAASR